MHSSTVGVVSEVAWFRGTQGTRRTKNRAATINEAFLVLGTGAVLKVPAQKDIQNNSNSAFLLAE